MHWLADDAVDRVRTIIGPTDSKKADKGTVRGDLGVDVMVNIVHASDSPENAEIELERFFEPEELFSYEMELHHDRKGLMGHADRSAGWRVRVEDLSHSPRHADAPVRIRHPRKVACMHPDAAIDPHEIRHGRAAKGSPWRSGVLHDAHVSHHDIPRGIHIVTVKGGKMIPFFLNDAKAARWSSIPLASA